MSAPRTTEAPSPPTARNGDPTAAAAKKKGQSGQASGGPPAGQQQPNLSDPSTTPSGPTNCYVSGIPLHWTEDDLSRCFSQCGSVELTKILLDTSRQSRGAGFVHFTTHADALRAIQTLNGFQPPDAAMDMQGGGGGPTRGGRFGVSFAHEKERSAHAHATTAGGVMNGTGMGNGNGAGRHANGAVMRHHGGSGMSHPPHPDGAFGDPIAIYVAGLPKSMSKADVEQLFAPFAVNGPIIQTKILTDPNTEMSRGIAFVKFQRKLDAANAISQMDAIAIEGADLPLQVRWAKERQLQAQHTGGGGAMRGHQQRYGAFYGQVPGALYPPPPFGPNGPLLMHSPYLPYPATGGPNDLYGAAAAAGPYGGLPPGFLESFAGMTAAYGGMPMGQGGFGMPPPLPQQQQAFSDGGPPQQGASPSHQQQFYAFPQPSMYMPAPSMPIPAPAATAIGGVATLPQVSNQPVNLAATAAAATSASPPSAASAQQQQQQPPLPSHMLPPLQMPGGGMAPLPYGYYPPMMQQPQQQQQPQQGNFFPQQFFAQWQQQQQQLQQQQQQQQQPPQQHPSQQSPPQQSQPSHSPEDASSAQPQ